jgi:uncharacterized protein YacL
MKEITVATLGLCIGLLISSLAIHHQDMVKIQSKLDQIYSNSLPQKITANFIIYTNQP